MAQYVSPFVTAGNGAGSKNSSGSGKSKYTSPFNTVGDSIAQHSKDLAASAPLLTPTSDLQTNNQKQQQQQNGGFFHRALADIGNIGKSVVVGTAKAARAVARPTLDIVSGQGGKSAHDTAQLTSDVSGGSVNQFAKAAAAVPAAVSREVHNKPIDDIQQKTFGTTDPTKIAKKIVGSTVGTAAMVVGGGETGGVKAAAEAGAKTVAKRAAKDAAIGSAVGASGTEVSNPDASVKEVLKNAAIGGVTGAIIPIGAKGAKKGYDLFFRKTPTEITPTPIAVTDKSTGATKGTVSSVLPKSNGVGQAPPAIVRPSDAGFTDGEFRAAFKAPAKEVVKNTPEVSSAFTQTGSKDPLTLTMTTLAQTGAKGKVGKIVDTMVPGLSASDRNTLVEQLAANKDPHEAANLLYDAAHHHETAANAAEHLTGTPMDKSISFNNPSELESAQRQQLHVRVAQINKALDAHGSGTTEQTPEALSSLLKAKQTAQDVLDNKTKFEEAYPKAVPAAQPVKPLPFIGDVAEPSAKPNGVVDKIPSVAAGDSSRQAVVNRKVAVAATNDTFHQAEADAAWKSLSKEDQTLFDKSEVGPGMSNKAGMDRLIRIAKSQAKDPEALIKYAKIHAQDMETVLAHRQALHPETGALTNYRPHLYDRTDQATNDFLATRENKYAMAIKNGKKPGYTEHRIIPTYAEAERLAREGSVTLKRANTNAHEDYLQALKQTANENGQAALIRGLKEAHGSSSVFHVGVSPKGENLGNLEIPGARGYSMPAALAEHYNERAPVTEPVNPNAGSKLYKGYRAVNQGGKNTIFAGGVFHGTQSALTIAGQQLFTTIRHPSQVVQNLRLIGDTFSPKAREAHLHALTTNGADHIDGMSSVERQRLANLTFTGTEIKADVGGGKQGLLNKLPGIKQLHSLVFDRQLPAAKQMIFDQKTSKLDLTKSEDLAKARKIAHGINNMVGGIDSTVEGLSPKWARRVDNIALARDYQQGRIATVKNAVTKWGADNPEGTLARQAVVGKAIVSALPGMIALVAAGKLDPTDPRKVASALKGQLLNPQIPTSWRGAPSKSNPLGNPISLKLPATHLHDLALLISPVIDPNGTYSGDRTSGLKEFAASRLAFLPAAAEKIKANTDYYGNPIYGSDKAGNPISPGKAAANIALQGSPIPVVQGVRSATGEQNLAEAGLNEIGLKASGSTLPTDTAHARRLNEFYNTKTAISSSRSQVVKHMNDLVRQGNSGQANRLASEFNSSLNARTMPFRTKYANNYNPAFDKEFENMKIAPTSRAMTAREKAIKQADAVLQ